MFTLKALVLMNQSSIFGHGVETTRGVIEQVLRGVKLFDLSGIEHQDLVAVHDGLQPVGEKMKSRIKNLVALMAAQVARHRTTKCRAPG